MSETRSLHRKLAQVMYEAERIPKNGTAPTAMGGFKFVQVGDAADVIRKALAEQKVSMLPTSVEMIGETEHATASGKMMTTITVRTTWTLTDGDTGESISIQSMGSGADMGDKAVPKAQSNSMKYALLVGFLLSTGDDPEQHDTSDRQARPDGPPRPELERLAENLVGTVEVGKPPVDLRLRQTPDGPAFGWKLKAGRTGYQCLATGPLADALAMVPDLTGQQVRVWGKLEMIPWEKAGQSMPPFPRIAVSRVQTDDFTLPAPEEAETLPLGIVDDDLSDLSY